MATLKEVRQIITQHFPDANVNEIQEENHRILGSITSREFRDMNNEDRNRLVTEKVRDPLGLKALNVGILFPLAPGEDLDA